MGIDISKLPKLRPRQVFAALYRSGVGKTDERSKWRQYYNWAWQRYHRTKDWEWIVLCQKTQRALDEQAARAIRQYVPVPEANNITKKEDGDDLPAHWTDTLYGAIRGSEPVSIFSDEDDVPE